MFHNELQYSYIKLKINYLNTFNFIFKNFIRSLVIQEISRYNYLTRKKQIEADLIAAITRQEEALSRSQATIIEAEARGNWLQRSWRPVIMLVFATIVLTGTFCELPILSDTSRFWDLLEIGIGGYVIGRSAEKITGRLKGGRP